MLIPNMILKKIHMYISVVFCLHVTKSKQISKIIVATCSQGLYSIIEYSDSEYDTKKMSYVYICCFLFTCESRAANGSRAVTHDPYDPSKE